MSRDIAPFGLRMPPELKASIEEAAVKNGRSINAEIIARLQASFQYKAEFDLTSVPSSVLLHEVIARYKPDVKIEIGGTAAQDLGKDKRRKT